jgi:hypothetical protein
MAGSGGTDLSSIFAGRYLRSPVFDWLDEKYLEIVRLNVGRRIAWKPVAEHLATIEVHDGSGKPPTTRRLANIWLAVKAARSGELPVSIGRRQNTLPVERERSLDARPELVRGPVGTDPPAPQRRRRAVEEPPEEVSDEAALEQLADFWDSMETGDGAAGRQKKNKFRERLDALRAVKAAALADEKKAPI